MIKPLWLKLVLPLTLLSAGALGVHYWLNDGGLFLNLGTDLVGIVVTVAYVDWVIRRHESERWHGTESRISDRLEVFVNALISGVRSSLGFSPDIMDYSVSFSSDPKRVHQEVLRVAEQVLVPAARLRVGTLDEAGWRRLASHLQSVVTEAERILNTYSSRLEPRQIELLLDIQWEVQSALTFWQTFPDMAGVPADQLPETRTPPEILQEHGYESTAGALQRLLGLAKALNNV